MKLNITKDTTIGQIQDLFSSEFEFLKLGFFVDHNEDGILSADEEMKRHSISLGSFEQFKKEGEVEIKATTTSSDLEKTFTDDFGLDVQVFRKSGNVWLVTTKTDNWTITHHNQRAKEMANPVSAPEPTDYQEHD